MVEIVFLVSYHNKKGKKPISKRVLSLRKKAAKPQLKPRKNRN